MSKFGETTEEALALCKEIIIKDLSNCLQTNIELEFLDNNITRTEIFNQFQNIMNYINEKQIKIEKYKEAPELIRYSINNEISEYYLHFDSLRSNCRVTHQPDFGDAFIYYKSQKHFLEDSLVQYLTSFRSENHFHEECCEMIFKRLYDLLDNDDELFVSALYTRRGGIDISPVRYTKNCKIAEISKIIQIDSFIRNGIKQ